jgi:hypothetical protein
MNLQRQVESPVSRERGASPAAPARYLVAILGGAVVALVLFCASYVTLHATGYLPPPPLSNNVCTDEKLVFFRRNPPADPNLLVFGSSVAWRNIDSAALARELPGTTPLNAGFCGMQVNQSAFIAGWMLHHWPAVRQLVLVVSPLDYQQCRGTGQVFDPVDATRFVFEGDGMWSFYLRYFDPVSLNRNIRRQAMDRAQARILKVDRSFTRYGDGPLDTNENRGLFYGPMPALDPNCFAALHSLATGLAAAGRKLLVVATPIHPNWKRRYDAGGTYLAAYAQQMKAALADTGARLWNADEAAVLDASAFTDAIHVRWSSASILTNAVASKLRAE